MGDGQHPRRRHPRPLRRAGHRQDRVPGAGAPDRRGTGDLPAGDGPAERALCEDRARLLHVRHLLRLRHLRGRHRHVLGAQPRARIPQPGLRQLAGVGQARPRAGCDGRGLGLPVQPPRYHGHLRPRPAPLHPGLLPQVRVAGRGRGGGGRGGGRLPAAVPGGGRSAEARGLRHPDHARGHAYPREQPRRGRAPAGAGRARVHRAREGLPAGDGRPPRDPAQDAERHARDGGRRGAGAARAGAPARHRREQRRGRGRRRDRGDALR